MIVMAKEPKGAKRFGRPPKNPETPVGERSNTLMPVRIKPEIAERFVAFWNRYNAEHPRTDKSAHVELAIQQYLDREEPKLSE